MAEAKRVILRLREADINTFDLYEPIRLYLERNRYTLSEIEANYYFIYI